MMISRRDSNKNFNKILLCIGAGIFFIILWSSLRSFTLPFLESVTFLSSRVYTKITSSFNGVYLYVASNEALYKENVRLYTELQEEKAKYLELAVLKDDLKKYENFSFTSSTTSTFAKRIGAIDTLLYNTFRVNKGEIHNVSMGQLVVGPYNTLVGIIAETTNTTSLVASLWNGNEILGRISANGTVITLIGVDDGVYKAEVPHEMSLQVGDVILYDQNPSLTIGVIKKINDNEEDRFKEILVHLPFHPRMIDVVHIEDAI